MEAVMAANAGATAIINGNYGGHLQSNPFAVGSDFVTHLGGLVSHGTYDSKISQTDASAAAHSNPAKDKENDIALYVAQAPGSGGGFGPFTFGHGFLYVGANPLGNPPGIYEEALGGLTGPLSGQSLPLSAIGFANLKDGNKMLVIASTDGGVNVDFDDFRWAFKNHRTGTAEVYFLDGKGSVALARQNPAGDLIGATIPGQRHTNWNPFNHEMVHTYLKFESRPPR
jgi:hypothetical protein